jgi:hypothetical protein
VVTCQPTSVDEGLVDHYALDGNGDDHAGGDANGAVGANVLFLTGPPGDFASAGVGSVPPDDVISVRQADAFAPGHGGVTIAFWAKRDQADTDFGDGVLDALEGTETGYQSNLLGSGANANLLQFRLDDNLGASVNVIAQDAMPDTTVFHHYARTVDRTANLAVIYVDGFADSAIRISALTGSMAPNQDLGIGGLNNDVAKGLDGRLDGLRSDSPKLEAAEVWPLSNTW